ncbi:MurR/RpiR family transcriptional regulator [Radiobacillus kanasensis]|uniref:MurR/RpiR family transcriptional regulator n=1 Tax=Radiobacillus kanasensis TaxID=2844358 RepID=UPI001E30F045|nr:MurR/RpiR family transcriptional regulator [Radiobacillus kanasensis]UFT98713.1 MurR/RpiR family transcriptional regulator [Radiobacillus kanasensis]
MSYQLLFIKELLDSFKPTQRKAAEFILNHPSEVTNMSIQKLADRTNVSEATIIRLSKELGCDGFQDLKLKIASDLAKSNHDNRLYGDIPEDDSIQSLIQTVSMSNIQSIEETVAVLSETELEKAIAFLAEARVIAVYGIGASGVIAQDFKQKISRINRWCELALDRDSQITVSANLNEADVVLGISYSGQTTDIIDSLTVAKANGATIITLTKSGKNSVSDLADIKLHTRSLERDVRSGATGSRMAQLNVVDMLFLGVIKSDQDRNIAALEKTRKAVGVTKKRV